MYICIARIHKTPLTHCQRNANNRQTGGFSEFVETALVQQLDCAGSEFQTVGPAEAKERQPKVLQRTRGTVSSTCMTVSASNRKQKLPLIKTVQNKLLVVFIYLFYFILFYLFNSDHKDP